jgi:hypothetical protein
MTEEFITYFSPRGIRCPKCGVLLITTRNLEGQTVTCTGYDPFKGKCGFVGRVAKYPVGVNFI